MVHRCSSSKRTVNEDIVGKGRNLRTPLNNSSGSPMVKHRLHVWWWLSRKQDRLRYIKSICLNIDSGSNRNLYAASASISISFTSGPRQLCWMQSLMIVFQRQRPLCCMIWRRPSRPRCWWRRPPPPWLCPAPFPPHPAQNAPRVPAPVQLCRQLHSPRPRLTSWTTPRQVWTSLYKQYIDLTLRCILLSPW